MCTFFVYLDLILLGRSWVNPPVLSNHSVPAASLSSHRNDTHPRRRHQETGIICDGPCKGLLPSGRGYQAQKSCVESVRPRFLWQQSTVPYTDLWQYSLSVSTIWEESVTAPFNTGLLNNKQSLWVHGPFILVLTTWALQNLKRVTFTDGHGLETLSPQLRKCLSQALLPLQTSSALILMTSLTLR